jgi:hypothetical protein
MENAKKKMLPVGQLVTIVALIAVANFLGIFLAQKLLK